MKGPARILVHPGFHKTGTSSLQHFLRRNRQALAPHAQLKLPGDLTEAKRAARYFSRTGKLLALSDFQSAMLRHLSDLDDRDLVISSEVLTGHCPGKHGIMDHSSGVTLIAALVAVIRELFPTTRVDLLLTTRDPDSWLASVWKHSLAGVRCTDDLQTFSSKYRDAADWEGIKTAVSKQCHVDQTSLSTLENWRDHRFGPAAPIIEWLNLPEQIKTGLHPAIHGNPGPDAETVQKMLDLNASDLPDKEVHMRKKALLDLG